MRTRSLTAFGRGDLVASAMLPWSRKEMTQWPIVALRVVVALALILALALEALGVVPQGVLAACRDALRPYVW